MAQRWRGRQFFEKEAAKTPRQGQKAFGQFKRSCRPWWD
jgi:hypothetical protein